MKLLHPGNDPLCSHQWLPYEYEFGIIKRTNTWRAYVDWEAANMLSAHLMRVSKLVCVLCGAIRNVPTDASDEAPRKETTS